MSAASVRRWRVEPLDTLFFGDGRPFNQEDEGLAEAEPVFPPWPSTLAGAFRAAVARALGWDGHSDWSRMPEIVRVVGPSPEDPAPLAFGPPMLLCHCPEGEGERWEPLYPRPRHVLARDRVPRLLDPARGEDYDTDLGRIRLPAAEPGLGEPAEHWVTRCGLTRILAGEPPHPDQLVPDGRLYAREFRIGLQRDRLRRTAEHGMLYAVDHLRLFDGVGTGDEPRDRPRVALGLEVEGLEAAHGPSSPVPLGGLRRLAAFEEMEQGWPEATEPGDPPEDGRYLVYVLSPTRFRDGSWPAPGASLDGMFPGRLVFACCGRPQSIGGWDGRRGANGFGPRPNRPHLPAGSALFFEAGDGEARARLEKLWRRPDRRVGERTALGFGRFRLGYWPRRECGG